MASRAEQKQQARDERQRREQEDQERARRSRRLKLLGGVVLAALAIVAIAIALSSGGGDDEPESASGGAAESARLFAGIPQRGNELGRRNAPVTLHEFADLQCPFCRDYAVQAMPTLVGKYVRTGRVRMVFHNLTFLGPDSERGGQAAAAAGLQNRMFQFVDLFYRNQGTENSGYTTDEFLRRIGGQVAGLDVAKMMQQRESDAVRTRLAAAAATAERSNVESTPSFQIERRGQAPQPLEVSSLEPAEFERALDAALAGQ